MKAVHLTGYGRSVANLEVRDVPEPSAPQAGEVLVAVEYAPINFNDLMVLWGTFPWHPDTPAIIGNEGGGVVEAVGPDVSTVKVGDRVVLPLVSGTWRQRMVVSAAALAVVPSSADPKQAALLGINVTTAAMLLRDFVVLQPGDAVAFNAATSGIARWFYALARKMDVRTVGLVRRESDVEAVKAAGCDIVIVENESVADGLAKLGGLNVRLGLDVIGGKASGRLLEFLSANAKLVNYGSITEQPMELSGAAITFKQVKVEGFFLGFPEQATRAFGLLGELAAMLTEERIEQPISALYPIDRVRDAVEHSIAGGRVLLDMTAR